MESTNVYLTDGDLFEAVGATTSIFAGFLLAMHDGSEEHDHTKEEFDSLVSAWYAGGWAEKNRAYLAILEAKKRTPRRDVGSYSEDYLRTPRWTEGLRPDAIRRDGGRCKLCGRSTPWVEVHHRSYEHLGGDYEKELDDLVTLCGGDQGCHRWFHRTSPRGQRMVRKR